MTSNTPTAERRRRSVASLPPRLVVGVTLAAACLGVAVGAVVHFALAAPAQAAPSAVDLEGQAVWPPGKVLAPEIRLRDQSGDLVSLRALRGRTVLLVFMDSRCHQVCPVEGRVLSAALAGLSPQARPTLVVVSVDPWADTGSSARTAGRHWGFAGSWHWLLGSPGHLARVWRSYRIYVKRAAGDIVHSDAVYLIDRHGYERAGFLFPFVPQPVERDLVRLARESGA